MFLLLVEARALFGGQTLVVVEEGARRALAAGEALRVAVAWHDAVQRLARASTLRRTVVVDHVSGTAARCEEEATISNGHLFSMLSPAALERTFCAARLSSDGSSSRQGIGR